MISSCTPSPDASHPPRAVRLGFWFAFTRIIGFFFPPEKGTVHFGLNYSKMEANMIARKPAVILYCL